jgi:hypothetical protein
MAPHRLEVIVWKVPSLVGNAVAVAIIGMLLGTYPLLLLLFLFSNTYYLRLSRSVLSHRYEPSWASYPDLARRARYWLDFRLWAVWQRCDSFRNRCYRKQSRH